MKNPYLPAQKGALIGGRYILRNPIGQGGMATVYLAYDQQTGLNVAVKLMRDELSDDLQFIRRFATEARSAATLDHPNIVRVLDYGEDQGLRYIVQEYIEGQTLKQIIEQYGAIDWMTAIHLAVQIASGLQQAHSKGIIHRDIKPQNVLITPDQVAKVTDFGIARAATSNTVTLTEGVAFGSVHYFSPEQARGGLVTERSDLYSLGIVLYEMLTGELPFDGETSVAVAIKQLQEMPLRPSSIVRKLPPALDDILFKAIQKDPNQRYQTAEELIQELGAFLRNPQGRYGVIQETTYNQSQPSWDYQNLRRPEEGNQNSNFQMISEVESNLAKQTRRRIRETLIVLMVIAVAVYGLTILVKNAATQFPQPRQTILSSEVVVERYVGRTRTEVEAEIQALFGDQVQWIPVKSETQEEGIIFEQDPQYGTKLKPDQLRITLKYSAGREQRTVPQLIGKKEREAREELTKAHLSVLISKEMSESVPLGTVIRTEPMAGQEVPLGSSVKLVLSSGNGITKIPPLVGLNYPEAERRAQEAQIQLKWRSVHDTDDEQDTESTLPVDKRILLIQHTDQDTEVKTGTVLEVEYGTEEDYARLQQGLPVGRSTGNFVVPNFVGMGYAQAVSYAQQIWPAKSQPIQIISQGMLSGDESRYQILRQSIEPGTTINPNETKLILYYGSR